MTKLIFFADNDTTSDAKEVNAAMLKEQNVDAYVFVGDGPYSKSGTSWVNMMKQSFDDKKDKMIWSRGNHDEDESESKQTQKDMEAWFPEAKGAGISDCWISAKQVGNTYVISMDTQDLDVEFKRDQFNFVTAELQKAKQLRQSGQIDWIIVLFHKPFFTLKTSHSPYTAVRFLYKEIFRDAQVDFCVSGHNHNTQLWKPMIPNQSEANGEGEQLFTLMPDNKTYDFSKDHGQLFIVSGHAGHEWNTINDSGAGVTNVMHYRDEGKFGYTVIETTGKKAKVLSKDTDNATTFEYDVSREGTTTEPPECTDPAKCIDPTTRECRPMSANEQRNPTTGLCEFKPPVGCPTGQCKDPSTGQCRTPNADEHISPTDGTCQKNPPGEDKVCPENWHYHQELQRCIPDLEPTSGTIPICPPGYKWNGKVCQKEGTTFCPNGQCKDPQTGQCRNPGINERTNPVTGFCELIPPTGCPDGQCKDSTTGQCRQIGANEQKNPTTGLCEPKPVIGCPDGQCKDVTTGQCRPIGPNEEKDANGNCKPKTPTGGNVDEHGIQWMEAKGQKTIVEMTRDESDDDRWSGNVTGCRNGFEATFIGKSIGIASDGHFAMKQFGGNHSGGSASKQRWYDTGLRKNGDVQLQWEGPHPSNHDFELPDSKQFIKNIGDIEGKWIGLKWLVQTVTPNGSPSNGGIRCRMWVDRNAINDANKPANNWELVYDFIDGVDVKVINPQDYEAPDEIDAEVRRSGTQQHDIYGDGKIIENAKEGALGLHVRPLS